jgi:AAA15 family ATPase/GTPase
MLTGPNGSGKSSLFDAFATWYGNIGIGANSTRHTIKRLGLHLFPGSNA